MPRIRKHRRCRPMGDVRLLKPLGIAMRELPIHWIELDEFEAMRLCDSEGVSQIEAGARMLVSRGTVQRLLESGRRKVVQALLANEAIGLGSAEEISAVRIPITSEDPS